MAASVRVLKAACLLQTQKLVWNFKDSEGRYFGWVKETAEKGKETEHLDGSGCCECKNVQMLSLECVSMKN